jgi:hypothetical protein
LLKNKAISIPVEVENIRKPPKASAPKRVHPLKYPRNLNMIPQRIGADIANIPGFIISHYPAFATIATHVV